MDTTKMQTYTFSREADSVRISYSMDVDQDSTWMPIMLQFSSFLEGCGYVGIYQRVSAMIDGYDDDLK
jgi:hypothetical protein